MLLFSAKGQLWAFLQVCTILCSADCNTFAFPKFDVVIGDLIPSTQSFTYESGPKQVTAIAGSIFMVAAAILLSLPLPKDGKVDPLLPASERSPNS